MPHLVTRYNEYTNDIEVIGIATTPQSAHKLISRDIELKGKEMFKRQKGHYAYKLTITKDFVNLDNVLTYTITDIPADELVDLKRF